MKKTIIIIFLIGILSLFIWMGYISIFQFKKDTKSKLDKPTWDSVAYPNTKNY